MGEANLIAESAYERRHNSARTPFESALNWTCRLCLFASLTSPTLTHWFHPWIYERPVEYGTGVAGAVALLVRFYIYRNDEVHIYRGSGTPAGWHPSRIMAEASVRAYGLRSVVKSLLIYTFMFVLLGPVAFHFVKDYFGGKSPSAIVTLAVVAVTLGGYALALSRVTRVITTLATNLTTLPPSRAGRRLIRVGIVLSMLSLAAWPAYELAQVSYAVVRDRLFPTLLASGHDCRTARIFACDLALRWQKKRDDMHLLFGIAFYLPALLFSTVPAITLLAEWWCDRRTTPPRPGGSFSTPVSFRVAHLSDLHLTQSDETPCIESSHRGTNAVFRKLTAAYNDALAEVDAIVITGDVTDAGAPEEWTAFLDLLEEQLDDSARQRVVLLPGNHDVNIVDRSRLTAIEPDGQELRMARLVRTIAALDLVQGSRAWIVNESNHVVLLGDYLASLRQPLLDALRRGSIDVLAHEGGDVPLGSLPHVVWERAFPMMVTAVGPKGTGVAALVFDSCAPSSNIATNAFGHVRREALDRARTLLNDHRFVSTPVLLALHHHAAPPREPIGVIEHIKTGFMVLHNSETLNRWLRGLASPLVLHGHRHIACHNDVDNRITIVGARSTTLGDANPGASNRDPGFAILELEAQGFDSIAVRGESLLTVKRAPDTSSEGRS